MIKTLKKYLKQGYTVLAEDANTLEFYKIDNITKEVEKSFKIDEIDFNNRIIYLELKQSKPAILIVSNDSLELPLTVVENLNQAAEFMKVEATHVYRAWRREGRPDQLTYNNYILIKLTIP